MSNDEIILRVSCGTALLVNFFTLSFAIHNSCRHLYRRKITKSLIIIFYLFLFLNTLSNITVLIMAIISPETALRENRIEDEMQNHLIVLTATTNIGLFLSLGLTMFQLSLSIQVAVKEITESQAMCRKVASYVLAFKVLVAFPILTLFFFKTVEEFFLIMTAFAVVISIS